MTFSWAMQCHPGLFQNRIPFFGRNVYIVSENVQCHIRFQLAFYAHISSHRTRVFYIMVISYHNNTCWTVRWNLAVPQWYVRCNVSWIRIYVWLIERKLVTRITLVRDMDSCTILFYPRISINISGTFAEFMAGPFMEFQKSDFQRRDTFPSSRRMKSGFVVSQGAH